MEHQTVFALERGYRLLFVKCFLNDYGTASNIDIPLLFHFHILNQMLERPTYSSPTAIIVLNLLKICFKWLKSTETLQALFSADKSFYVTM